MNFVTWIALAFVAGTAGAVAYYKDFRWIAAILVLALPIALHAGFGWPHERDFPDSPMVAAVFRAPPAFLGFAVGVAAVLLRIVR